MNYIYDIKDDEIIGENWECRDPRNMYNNNLWQKVELSVGEKVKDWYLLQFRKPAPMNMPEYMKELN